MSVMAPMASRTTATTDRSVEGETMGVRFEVLRERDPLELRDEALRLVANARSPR